MLNYIILPKKYLEVKRTDNFCIIQTETGSDHPGAACGWDGPSTFLKTENQVLKGSQAGEGCRNEWLNPGTSKSQSK